VNHPGQEDYLDEHNGRWCITPEYPNGTYAYFCTVDTNWNSQYPYAVGPTFYGQHSNANVSSINETVTVYDASNASIYEDGLTNLAVAIYPNPAADLIAIQIGGLVKENLAIELVDLKGGIVGRHQINAGQTIAYFDVSTLYAGSYFIRISNNEYQITRKVMVK